MHALGTDSLPTLPTDSDNSLENVNIHLYVRIVMLQIFCYIFVYSKISNFLAKYELLYMGLEFRSVLRALMIIF